MGRDITLPSARLLAAAGIAAADLYDGENKDNLIAIDVGCDHAKLAIYLVQSGICRHVTASDIKEGPVSMARENVNRRTLMGTPLSEYIDIVLTDGLSGLDGLAEPADSIVAILERHVIKVARAPVDTKQAKCKTRIPLRGKQGSSRWVDASA